MRRSIRNNLFILSFGLLGASAPVAYAFQPPAGPEPSLDDLFNLIEPEKSSNNESPKPAPGAPANSDPRPAPPNTNIASETPAGKLQFNFRFAAWDDVLRELATLSGLTLDIQSTPPGSFSYFDKEAKSPSEAIEIINGYLIPRGYTLIRRDQFLVVANIESGIPENLIATIELEDLEKRANTEFVRVTFDLDQARAEDLIEDVRSLLGSNGNAVALGATNRMVVTGLGGNVKRVSKLLDGVRLAAGPTELSFRAFPLNNISAVDAEPTIRALLGVGSSFEQGSSGSSSSRSRGGDPRAQFMEMMASRMRGGDGGRGGDDRGRGGSSSSSSSSSSSATARVTTDTRTNSLFVVAKQADLLIVEQAIEQIDLPARDGVTQFETSTGPVLRVYEIEDGELDEIAETLMVMIPGVMINEDDRADVLHVVADEAKQREVKTLIDTIVGKGATQDVGIVPLMSLDSEWATMALANLFINEDEPPIIQPDWSGRNLIVRGSANHVLQVKTLVLQMAQSGTAGPQYGLTTGKIRQISLGGAPAEDFLPLLEQMWKSAGNGKIRIVRPGQSAPVEEPTSEPPKTQESGDPTTSINSILTFPVVFQPEKSSGQASSEEEANDVDAGVTLSIVGDQLVISGDDEAKLDELQIIISQLLQKFANQTQWSVYYLKAGEASSVASMLGKLFPDVEVDTTSSTTVSLSRLTSSTTTTQVQSANPVRVIPEERTNSLYISGPANRVREIEQVLEVLDNDEIPANYRDRVARSIPVYYASVDEVAEVLNSIYADRLPQQSGRGGDRGGFGGDAGGGLVAGELTFGVDSQTSQIIISSNEALYREVEALVQSLDEAAREARRTVKIINLEYSNAADVQSTLGTLIPKVTFSTSSSGNRFSSPRSGGSDSRTDSRDGSSRDSRGSSSGDDSRRRFFEEMMRRRSQEGGGGSSPFGGGGPPSFGGFRGRGGR